MKKIKKIIGRLALGFACSLLLGGAIGYLLINHEPQIEKVIVKELNNHKPKKIKHIEYGDEVQFARGAQVAEARKHFKSSIEDYGIGSIYMPKAGISVALLEGTSEWNLYNGVGTGRANQKLGEGLFVGLSHNLVGQTLLKKINQMEAEDFIYISDFESVYLYKTLEQKVVHENKGKYFEEPSLDEQPKLLLYRCEGGYGTEWRRIIYGEYVEKYPLDEVDPKILSGLNIELDVKKDSERPQEEIANATMETSEQVTIQRSETEERSNFIEKMLSEGLSLIEKNSILSTICLDIYKLYDAHFLFYSFLIMLFYLIYYFS